jgi:hypothetical protein
MKEKISERICNEKDYVYSCGRFALGQSNGGIKAFTGNDF